MADDAFRLIRPYVLQSSALRLAGTAARAQWRLLHRPQRIGILFAVDIFLAGNDVAALMVLFAKPHCGGAGLLPRVGIPSSAEVAFDVFATEDASPSRPCRRTIGSRKSNRGCYQKSFVHCGICPIPQIVPRISLQRERRKTQK